MRRNFETIRNILLAVAEKGIDDSNALRDELNLEEEVLGYHLKLLCNDARLITMESRGIGGNKSDSNFSKILLTWQGNDFLDAIGDEKAWMKVKKALSSGAKVATVEALKQVAKGAGAAGLAIILAENESDVIGITPNPFTGRAGEIAK